MSLSHQRYQTTPAHYAYQNFRRVQQAMFVLRHPKNDRCIAPFQWMNWYRRQPLAKNGVKELLVIAQDLSFYGVDLYKEQKLAELTERLAAIPGIEWIKLHYAYPTKFPYDLLPVMREKANVARYLDIALQHCSDNVLKLMRRNISKVETIALIKRIRLEVPGIHIRTTLLVGHPGETEEDFEELKQFVREMRFERLGVFPYSHEEDTFAGETYEDTIPQEVKQARAEEIMAIQQEIALEINRHKIGSVLKVVIDRKEEDYFIARTEYDSPEVDGEVLVSGKKTTIGRYYQVKITDAEEFDLYGEIV